LTAALNEIRENLVAFGEVHLRVFGASMAPAILPGDMVSIQRADISEISVGEVVMYCRDGRIFVHRVVSRKSSVAGASLITRGDRLGYEDSPISSIELLGRAVCLERHGRRMAVASQKEHPLLLSLFRASDNVTYLYIRLFSLWARGTNAEVSGKNAGGAIQCRM
jgi:signal peptidase I